MTAIVIVIATATVITIVIVIVIVIVAVTATDSFRTSIASPATGDAITAPRARAEKFD